MHWFESGEIDKDTAHILLNLKPLFTQTEIEESFKLLKSKKFKVSFADFKRFTEKKKLSSLGEYLNKIDPSDFYDRELKKFSFLPYSGLKILKPNGKYRPLLIPSPKDRIVLAAAFPKVRAILKPELEKFNALGLGLNQEEVMEFKRTLKGIQTDLNNGMPYVLKLDFKDFFSTIDRKILLKKLDKNFKGKYQRRLLRFIKASIENNIEANADFHGTFGYLKLRTNGIPQGLSYSPLLSSFYALTLDKKVKKVSDCRGFRYLDDMIILCTSKEQGVKIYEMINNISRAMGLRLHPLTDDGKTQLFDIDERKKFEFLGIEVSKDSFFIPNEAVEDFKKTFETEIVSGDIITKFSFQEVAKAYRTFAGGWENHYKSLCPNDFIRVEKEINSYLDSYIKRGNNKKRVNFFKPNGLIVSHPFIISH